jgi:hypothetical protein
MKEPQLVYIPVSVEDELPNVEGDYLTFHSTKTGADESYTSIELYQLFKQKI